MATYSHCAGCLHMTETTDAGICFDCHRRKDAPARAYPRTPNDEDNKQQQSTPRWGATRGIA